uniref:Hexamerin-like protein 2 n=1 Tax=Xya japonica TaxID=1661859 RepID=A0A2I6SDD0_9ORTH|nr:hexamerin 2 [Xya japonica]AUO15582.1 hexamerin-like protein 2 [Xya japonica]
MRTATGALLLLLVGLTAAKVVSEKRMVGKDVLLKQKTIYQLFYRITQDELFPEFQEIAHSYVLEDNVNNYKRPEAVYQFLSLYRESEDFLPKGKVFSVFYPKHWEYAQRFFDLLYFAKDYDTFYKTAVWGRYFVNEGVFVYALHVAVLHREDTRDFVLPPPYEIYPQFYVTGDVITKAYEAKLLGQGVESEKPVVILANYTGYPEPWTPEQVLSYFTEDVGFNSYFAYLALQYPAFLNNSYYGVNTYRRGELFYYTLQQLYARYHLERLSYKFPEVDVADYYTKTQYGYAPFTTYPNGYGAPVRPVGVAPVEYDVFSVEGLTNLEKRIRNAIDFGVFYSQGLEYVRLTKEKGVDLLGNVLLASGDSVNREYYPSFYKWLISLYGRVVDPTHEYEVPPSSLEQLETALRDPVYFSIVKRILNIFEQYLNKLPYYTKEELVVPGVKIENVEVDKLVTFFDYFYIDMKNVIPVQSREEASQISIRARQSRLNHKPFTYKVQVSSDKALDAVVRVYVGPKYDYLGNELSLDERRKYYFEIDRFPYQIQSGKNVIERNSRDSFFFGSDAPTYKDLYRRVEKAIHGGETYYYEDNTHHCGFPDRLMLPHGTKSGFPLSFYVIITPYQKVEPVKNYDTCRIDMRTMFSEGYSFGYPFDRPIREYEFVTPNMYFKDVVVYHRSQDEINSSVRV